MRTVTVILVAALGTIAVLFMVGAMGVYSGSYNVAVSSGHGEFVHDTLEKLMVESVRSHADEITVPAGLNLDDPAVAQRGVSGYEAMCVMCHGAPGAEPAGWSQALYPAPPDLVHAQEEHGWSAAEIFWIIKNGIKDTGMAAFGEVHDDADIWELTALVQQLRSLSPDRYSSMVEQAKSGADQHAHTGEQQGHGH